MEYEQNTESDEYHRLIQDRRLLKSIDTLRDAMHRKIERVKKGLQHYCHMDVIRYTGKPLDIQSVFVMMSGNAAGLQPSAGGEGVGQAFNKNPALKELAAQMYHTMFPHKGVGEDKTLGGRRRTTEALNNFLPEA